MSSPSTPPNGFFERLNTAVRTSITLKVISVGILILLLLIPTEMVRSLIRERENRKRDATYEVSSKWADPRY